MRKLSIQHRKNLSKSLNKTYLSRKLELLISMKKNKNKCYEIKSSRNNPRYIWPLWREYYGKDFPKGKFACHTCDNRLCINIFHIFPGTAKDNMDDMRSKHRDNPPAGERCVWAKLTKDEVLQIRQLWVSGKHTYNMIAEIFSVTARNIKIIIQRRTWKHV